MTVCGVTGASLPALLPPRDEVGTAVAAAPRVWVGPLPASECPTFPPPTPSP